MSDFSKPFCKLAFQKGNLYLVKGWNGFISPDGKFYKVVRRDELESYHDHVAEEISRQIYNKDLLTIYKCLIRNKPVFANYRLSSKDMLIQLLGFVNYEHKCKGDFIDIKGPNPIYCGHKTTNQQMRTVLDLIKLNGDDMQSLYYLINNEDDIKLRGMLL